MLDPSDLLFKDILYDLNDTNKTSVYSPHKGYANLFPLALGLISPYNDTLLEAQIDFMSDPLEIWTEFGLRSLSY